MRRVLTLLTLAGFLLATGIYVFIYLFRAFRLGDPTGVGTVRIWHGDPFARAILTAVFFAVGLIVLLFVLQAGSGPRRAGSVTVRPDLWEWLVRRGETTNEPPERIAERAIAAYRADLEARSRL